MKRLMSSAFLLILAAAVAVFAVTCGQADKKAVNDSNLNNQGNNGDDDAATDDDDNDDNDDDNDTSPDDDTADTAACCDSFNFCVTASQTNCFNQYGGTWYFGQACGNNPCGTPSGACCKPDHSCAGRVTQSYCQGLSGKWNGDTDCANVSC